MDSDGKFWVIISGFGTAIIIGVIIAVAVTNYIQNKQILQAQTCEQVVAISSSVTGLTERLAICKLTNKKE